MIKSVSRNGEIYRNTNNVGVIYEYFGNNSFTESDVTELCDLIHQSKVFFELSILNVRGTKKYYVSFFYGEPGYANNINNYDPVAFNRRYTDILNLKPKIEKLKMFENKISDTNLKLYSFKDNDDNLEYLEKSVKSGGMAYDEDSFNKALLKRYFPEYVEKSIGNMDYKNYILQTFYQKDTNFEFFNIDQAIFEPVLNFVAGNEFFLFPFYYSGITQKTGNMEYQTLDITNDVMFLDSKIGKDCDAYLKKISIAPKKEGIVTDVKNDEVSIDGSKSRFPISEVGDAQNMFFEMNTSLFLYTKKPDVSSFLSDFVSKFGTQTSLVPKKVSKEFNEMYLSHNNFDQIFHYGHVKNVAGMMKLTKEYTKPNKRGVHIGNEYFSNNEMNVNFFDIVGLDPSDGTLADRANGFIIGDSGSGKTFFAKELVKRNKTEQVIVFDNLANFELMVDETNAEEFHVMKYGPTFPNIIGKINSSNISEKQGILYKIVIGPNTEISGELKESIRGICNVFMEKIIGGTFKLDDFASYVKTVDSSVISEDGKRVFLNKIYGLNTNMKAILNNPNDIFEAFLEKQKIILSYQNLTKESLESKNFVISILIDSVMAYLTDKRQLPEEMRKFKYSILMFDEAHNMFNGNPILEFSMGRAVREIRNLFASVICISQGFGDFRLKTQNEELAFYDQTSFHFVLSPGQWSKYVEFYSDKGGKKDLVFSNLRPQIMKIEEKYNEDAKAEADGKLVGKRTRFCVFGYKTANSYYIVNTTAKKKSISV